MMCVRRMHAWVRDGGGCIITLLRRAVCGLDSWATQVPQEKIVYVCYILYYKLLPMLKARHWLGSYALSTELFYISSVLHYSLKCRKIHK